MCRHRAISLVLLFIFGATQALAKKWHPRIKAEPLREGAPTSPAQVLIIVLTFAFSFIYVLFYLCCYQQI
jgi:hypothetical protein